MKKIALFMLPVLMYQSTVAQIAINTTNAAPHSSAMLDITSTDKGVLLPRMSTAARTAIASPAKGLLVMDTTTNSLWYHDGTAWQEGISTLNNLWKPNGTDIYNNNTAGVGIGTTTPNANALLHINLGNSLTRGLLVTGTFNFSSTVPNLGAGSRMMFYPGKAAFRAGYADGAQWDNGNVGSFSTSFGYSNIANGFASAAMGYYTTASGSGSTAIGYFTHASGDNSTAMGFYTTASGYASTAMGEETIASGDISTAMGHYTTAKAFGAISIGLSNDNTDAPSATSPASTDRIFQIGNGNNSSGIKSNAMTVLRNGNVGIGTLNPLQLLDVNGTVKANGITLPTSGGTASVINYYEETSFDAALTNTAQTTTYMAAYTIKAVRVGDKVTLTFPVDATTLNISNGGGDIKVATVPARLRPAANQYFTVLIRNGGTDGVGLAFVRASGDILVKPGAAANSGNWNGSSNCGFYAFSVSYVVQ